MKHKKEFIAYLAKDALDNWDQPDTQTKLMQFMFFTDLTLAQAKRVIKGLYEENKNV